MASARRTAFLVGFAVAVRGAIARSEEPTRPVHVALAWTRAPGAERCISAEEMATRTRELASSGTLLALDKTGADFFVVGRIEHRADGFRAEFVLRDANGRPLGERELESPARSCRALDESLILALVLLVETPGVRTAVHGDGAEELAEIAPPLQTESPTALRSAAPSPPLRYLPRPRRRRWTLELGIGASAALGFAPKATLGPTLFATTRPPGFIPIVVRAAAYPFGVDRVTVPGEGISVRGFVGGVELCPLDLAHRSIVVRACTGAHLATLYAEPFGAQSNPGALLFMVLPLRAELRARLGAVDPYVAATARLSPTSPAFIYRTPEVEERVSFAVPWLTAELDVGVAWRALP